jgi:threonine dehydrogenase-like Zn-dependent dehydrogenase
MKTKAVRLYGANDLRLETFELPEIKDDEILVKIISDSICMSTYKLLIQGKLHKRAPQDIEKNPIIIGHEFAGTIIQVGKKWQSEFKVGEKFAQQPALNYKGSLASPGYSYRFYGGSATYAIVPNEVMELGCLLHYNGEAFFDASLAEPMSCIIGGYNAMYHTNKRNYQHASGIKPNGNVLILGGAGPMGLGAIEYPLTLAHKPKQIVVVDIDDHRLNRAKELVSPQYGITHGVSITYVNSKNYSNPYDELMKLTNGVGYHDIFVYAPIKEICELGDRLLAFDGCFNFFAGPADKTFSANINLYNCHYTSTHILGSTGGNVDDLKESLLLSSQNKIRPALMVSHICGIDTIANTVVNLPKFKNGKILSYTHLDLPLTAISDFATLGQTNPLFAQLHISCQKHHGL